VAVTTLPEPITPPVRRQVVAVPTRADRVFEGIVIGAAWSVLIILGLITVFLCLEAWPAFRDVGIVHFLTRFEWFPDNSPPLLGVAALLYGTLVIALVALAIALPVAVGSALFVNEYAPRWLSQPLVTMIDMLAAVPSLIYGMWGLYWLQPRLNGTSRWLSDHLGFIPIFKTSREVFGSSMFVCGIVVAMMTLPIIASVSREVFAQVPRTTCEGALALGGTRWGMIRRVILPFGRSGIIGAALLGLGRALGETIAVTVILFIPRGGHFDWTIFDGGATFASQIATNASEFNNPTSAGAYIASGLVLFVLTFAVNFAARSIIGDKKGD
jgi:phosphate transport system permease protein